MCIVYGVFCRIVVGVGGVCVRLGVIAALLLLLREAGAGLGCPSFMFVRCDSGMYGVGVRRPDECRRKTASGY